MLEDILEKKISMCFSLYLFDKKFITREFGPNKKNDKINTKKN